MFFNKKKKIKIAFNVFEKKNYMWNILVLKNILYNTFIVSLNFVFAYRLFTCYIFFKIYKYITN